MVASNVVARGTMKKKNSRRGVGIGKSAGPLRTRVQIFSNNSVIHRVVSITYFIDFKFRVNQIALLFLDSGFLNLPWLRSLSCYDKAFLVHPVPA